MLDKENRINTKADLADWLAYESKKYPCGIIHRIFLLGEAAILRRHQILLRKTEYFLNANKKLRYYVSRLKLMRLQSAHSLYVPLNCCGRGLRIMHLGPVLMNNRVTLGKDCSVHMNAALVAGGTSHGVPTLGDNVVVGYGAVVLGAVHIASYVAIGANAVVNKDCYEEHVAIAGVPAKIISQNGSDSWGSGAKDA